MKKSPVVDMSCADCFGVVVKAETGVEYSTQTCGMCCRHPTVEGYFIPVNSGNQNWIEDELHKHLCDEADELPRKSIEAIDAILEELPNVKMRVDMENLKYSEEAWIHVIILEDGGEFSPFYGLKDRKAVFLYGNCD